MPLIPTTRFGHPVTQRNAPQPHHSTRLTRTELFAIPGGMALIVGLVVQLSTRELWLAGVALGVTLVVTLVLVAIFNRDAQRERTSVRTRPEDRPEQGNGA